MIAINKLRGNYLVYKFKNIKYFIIIIVLIKMANVSSYQNIEPIHVNVKITV